MSWDTILALKVVLVHNFKLKSKLAHNFGTEGSKIYASLKILS
jgi:hypothetical protein